jgi:histone-lysine N-methyltransferase SETD8
VEIEGKGRGVIATKTFEKDEFVVEYAGELVNITTAKQREDLYDKDQEVGCYMYYFNHKNKSYW